MTSVLFETKIECSMFFCLVEFVMNKMTHFVINKGPSQLQAERYVGKIGLFCKGERLTFLKTRCNSESIPRYNLPTVCFCMSHDIREYTQGVLSPR